MKSSNYKALFSISVNHTYFESKRNDCIQISPGAMTETLQKRFGIKIRRTLTGIGIYTNNTGSETDFFEYVKNVTGYDSFDFNIVVRPQIFWSVTELPIKWLGTFIYDSKLCASKGGNTFVLIPELNNEIRQNNSGTITIRFDDLTKHPQEVSYNIEFRARSTQWNYYIINRSKVKLTNPAINGKHSAISFGGPEIEVTPDGISALKFTSGENLLPLSEIPKYKFDLVDKLNGSNSSMRSIYKGLPTPDPIRTSVMEINGKSGWTSPMYIYI